MLRLCHVHGDCSLASRKQHRSARNFQIGMLCRNDRRVAASRLKHRMSRGRESGAAIIDEARIVSKADSRRFISAMPG